MVRSVVLLLVGAVAGSAIVWQLQLRSNESHDSLSPGPASAVIEPDSDLNPVSNPGAEPVNALAADASAATATTTSPGFATQRLAIYEAAAGANDVAELESMIRVASVAPGSRLRDLELSVLLARLGEFDPAHAIDFARELYLEPEFLVPLYRQWVVKDQEAAIRSLMLVSPAAVQREIALDMLAITGFNKEGVALVARALPEADRRSFEIDALVRQAESDPAAAVIALAALDDDSLRSQTMSRIAETVALSDPDAALELAELISDPSLRTGFRQMVVRAWAQSDPGRAFAYVETAESTELPNLMSAIAVLATSDASRALALADKLPANQQFVRLNVLRELAEQEPDLAESMLVDLPLGQERDQLLQAIAVAKGRNNPDGALAWARSLNPPSPDAVASVLQGIADVDLDRAIDLVLEELDSPGAAQGMGINSQLSYLTLMLRISQSSPGGGSGQFGRIADRLIDSENPMARSMMSSMLSQWATTESEAAIDWLISNGGELDSFAYSNVARQLADRDIDAALATLGRMPEEHRGTWLSGTLASLARNDINQAVAVLEQNRGLAGYGEAFASVTQEIARTDPVRAARMFDQAPMSDQLRGAAYSISREWAARDPAEAADWARGQDDANVRNNSLNSVMSVWAQQDSSQARRWTMQLAAGPERDAALQGYVTTIAQTGEFDPQLLAAFTDERAGQQAASSAIANIGRTDPERARELLDEHIHDEDIRRSTERNLARSGGSGSGISVSSGGVIYFN